MLNCHDCGLTNRPYDSHCAICGHQIQDQAAADAKRKEWDALGPKLREEQEAVFEKMRASRVNHQEWLRTHRLVHAIAGALLLNFIMACATFFQAKWCIFFDLSLGAAAGLLLNRYHGGAWHGAAIFGAAAVVSVLLKIPFLGSGFEVGLWLVAVVGIFFLTCIGYYMGLKLDLDHADRSVTA